MRKLILVFTAVVLTASGFAQKTADLGIWGGSSTYWGDIKGVPPMQTFNLNFGAFFRYNFNTRVAMRAQILSGSFSAVGNVEDIGFEFAKRAGYIADDGDKLFEVSAGGKKDTVHTLYFGRSWNYVFSV